MAQRRLSREALKAHLEVAARLQGASVPIPTEQVSMIPPCEECVWQKNTDTPGHAVGLASFVSPDGEWLCAHHAALYQE